MWWCWESKPSVSNFFIFHGILSYLLLPLINYHTSYNRVGRNVAAGMTGGLAYILDEDDTLIPKVTLLLVLFSLKN